jgi:SAM-dependent methyltransferase
MNAKEHRINWSDKRYYDMLVDQRKFMWAEDMLDVYARWFGLEPGMNAIDVGCGLGYLGYTYWSYFGEGGTYFGIDANADLLTDAAAAARDWADKGEAYFLKSDAYRLPFPDDFADWTMCQTLLMHLERPEDALREMIRVTRPGGLISCNEPDNLSASLRWGYNNLPELGLEEELLLLKLALVSHRGRIALGQGDNEIGAKLPEMMDSVGLVDIAARQNDRVRFLIPPYDGPRQQNLLEMFKKEMSEDAMRIWRERWKEQYLAGGGDISDFDTAFKTVENNRSQLLALLERGEFYSCGSGKFYIIKGRKPG